VSSRSVGLVLSAVALAALAGCGKDYSPNTYASNAVQQANKVEVGIVIGFREVMISASGTVGAVTGGAAGGVLGAQSDVVGIGSALGAVGGTAIGGVVGTAIEHASGDTTGWEYIIRKSNGELLSVTQREPRPIAVGQKVLVITGNQARVVPDYSVELPVVADDKAKPRHDAKAPSGDKPAPAVAAPAAPPAAAEPEATANPAPAPIADKPVEAVAPATPSVPAATEAEPAQAAAPKAEPEATAQAVTPTTEETAPDTSGSTESSTPSVTEQTAAPEASEPAANTP